MGPPRGYMARRGGQQAAALQDEQSRGTYFGSLIQRPTRRKAVMTPKVSVIVPFRNALPQLPVLVSALERQAASREAFEVIWIDDASGDEGGAWLQEHLPAGWRLLVHTTPRGSYAARNTGLRVAASDNLAFIDVDCRPQEDWIEQGLACLASAPRIAGRVELELSGSPSAAELVDAGRFLRQRRYVQEGFGATANLFVQRPVFDSVGGFNEQLRSGGDYEFGLRCSKAGIPIQYADDVVVSLREERRRACITRTAIT